MSLFFVADGVSYRALFKNSTLLRETFAGAPPSMAVDMSVLVIGRPGKLEPISVPEASLTANTESPAGAGNPKPVDGQSALIVKGGLTLTDGEVQRRTLHILHSLPVQDSHQQPRTSTLFSTVLTQPWKEIFGVWGETGVHLTRTPDTLPQTGRETARSAQPVPSSHAHLIPMVKVCSLIYDPNVNSNCRATLMYIYSHEIDRNQQHTNDREDISPGLKMALKGQ